MSTEDFSAELPDELLEQIAGGVLSAADKKEITKMVEQRLAAGQSVMRIRSGFVAKAEEARENNASIARTYDEIVDFIDSQAWGL